MITLDARSDLSRPSRYDPRWEYNYSVQRYHTTLKGVYLRLPLRAAFFGTSVLVTFAFVLLSTPRARSSCIFYLQLASLLLFMSYLLLDIVVFGHLYIKEMWPIFEVDRLRRFTWAGYALRQLNPWFADIPLIFKILALYPTSLNTTRRRMAMVAIPVILKVPRMGLTISCAIEQLTRTELQNYYLGVNLHYLIEGCLQVIDNGYSFCILLHKLRQLQQARSQTHVHSSSRSKRRLRFLFEALFLTFLPALITQILLVAFLAAIPLGPHSTRRASFPIARGGEHLLFTNVIVTVYSSILATSWTSLRESGSKREDEPMVSDHLHRLATLGRRQRVGSGSASSLRKWRRAQQLKQSKNAENRSLFASMFADEDHEDINDEVGHVLHRNGYQGSSITDSYRSSY